MPDVVRFVDSISASPTTRLDINDGATWWVKKFDAPPPRLRRSTSANAMTDGVTVGSATYDARTLTVELECRKATQDLAATEHQKLWRELDRPVNYLQYQPQGASKPVFFALYRSDASALEDVRAQAAMRTITVELLAMPFALGLRELLGPFTVNANPAAGSNPCYVDLPAIIGDVAAPLTYWDNPSGGSSYRNRLVCMETSDAHYLATAQLETWTAYTDTSNPGGGPDAAMSGTGVNNYMRTTFATVNAIAARVGTTSLSLSGTFRLLAFVRRTGTTSTLQVRARQLRGATVVATGATVTLAATTTRQLVDLGFFSWPETVKVSGGGTSVAVGRALDLWAGRTGGTDQLDWDCVVLLPVGTRSDVKSLTTLAASLAQDYRLTVVDGQAYESNLAADPAAGTAQLNQVPAAGAEPWASPGVGNRLHVIAYGDDSNKACAVTTSTSVSLAYFPRYLHVRPVST